MNEEQVAALERGWRECMRGGGRPEVIILVDPPPHHINWWRTDMDTEQPQGLMAFRETPEAMEEREERQSKRRLRQLQGEVELTKPKPGIATTEFWLTVLAGLGVPTLKFMGIDVGIETMAVVCAYIGGRAVVKFNRG